MADAEKGKTQEAVFSSDSDSSCCDSECCSCLNELHVVYEQDIMEESFVQHSNPKLMVTNGTTSPVQASKSLVSLVVKPTDSGHVGCFGQDSWSAMRSKNEVDNAVMSLNDLDQYDTMLQGLIDELSTISDKLVSCVPISTCSYALGLWSLFVCPSIDLYVTVLAACYVHYYPAHMCKG